MTGFNDPRVTDTLKAVQALREKHSALSAGDGDKPREFGSNPKLVRSTSSASLDSLISLDYFFGTLTNSNGSSATVAGAIRADSAAGFTITGNGQTTLPADVPATPTRRSPVDLQQHRGPQRLRRIIKRLRQVERLWWFVERLRGASAN